MTKSHGIAIGIERLGNEFMMTFTMQGTLTHHDYEIITPLLECALEGVKQPKINALVDLTKLQGWELRAAWDDFKLGLKHGSEFQNIALVGNKEWQELAAKVGSWFIAGEIRNFTDKQQALAWLQGKDA